jgi:hypothetical protein
LQKLLQFYRKCNDLEGIAEATASIARNETELKDLKTKVRNSSDKLSETTKKRQQHARKRSMSTSSLPKFIATESETAPPTKSSGTKQPVVVNSCPVTPETKGPHALYEFVGVHYGELTCKAGDLLTTKSENGEWILCVLTETGKEGWLPKSYVSVVKEDVVRPSVKTPFDED